MLENNEQARAAALTILEGYEPRATSLLSYQSGGSVIVIGNESAIALCADLESPLSFTGLLTAGEAKTLAGQVVAVKNRSIELQGHLGAFVVTLTDPAGISEKYTADMILDASPQPLINTQLLPAGYLQDEVTAQNIALIKQQLLEMVGEFEKPKYFKYDPSICAHGSNGNTVCTNCVDACPASAISSLIETIQVDPYLCQGGGVCATVCPSGAIQYVYPQLSDSGNQVRQMLQTYRQKGGENPVIVFYVGETLPNDLYAANPTVLPVKVEEIASVGMDLCLSSLAYGASQVVLLANEDAPPLSLQHLNNQLEWLQALLSGLNLNPERVRILPSNETLELLTDLSQFEPALYTMPDNKRAAIFQALDHLYQQVKKSRELISLPAGAPFGSAIIDEKSCTLCMACVGACPGKALQDGSNREMPEVFFIESNCIQCGTCTQTCPEQAISISPRMIFDREKRNRSRVLHQDVPFACISCGKPFAPTSVIQKMNFKLKGHHMFQTARALDRLKMCEDCRVADIVQDPEALNGNFDPLNNGSAKTLS